MWDVYHSVLVYIYIYERIPMFKIFTILSRATSLSNSNVATLLIYDNEIQSPHSCAVINLIIWSWSRIFVDLVSPKLVWDFITSYENKWPIRFFFPITNSKCVSVFCVWFLDSMFAGNRSSRCRRFMLGMYPTYIIWYRLIARRHRA